MFYSLSIAHVRIVGRANARNLQILHFVCRYSKQVAVEIGLDLLLIIKARLWLNLAFTENERAILGLNFWRKWGQQSIGRAHLLC